MLERIQAMPDNVIGLRASGTVSRDEYQSIVDPAIQEGLSRAPKLRALFQVADGTDFQAGAMVADAQVGLSHPFSWERIAIVTDLDWLRRTIHALGWLVPGDVRIFPNAEFEQAKSWVSE